MIQVTCNGNACVTIEVTMLGILAIYSTIYYHTSSELKVRDPAKQIHRWSRRKRMEPDKGHLPLPTEHDIEPDAAITVAVRNGKHVSPLAECAVEKSGTTRDVQQFVGVQKRSL